MDITLIGLNYRTASVDIREKFALSQFCRPENWAIPCTGDIQESMILSTCNRVELLGIGSADSKPQLLAHWAAKCNTAVSELNNYIYFYKNLEAVRHIFEVASSLDSMVLGEPQILGQLKTAYRNAVEAKCVGSILNRLMHKAFSVAKRVRSETGIASNAVSISYAAVELAKRIFTDFSRHKAILIGAGEMAELAAMHLSQAGIAEILVLNRTLSRAGELAEKVRGKALPFDALRKSLVDVDIVISSTGSPEPVLTKDDVKSLLRERKNRPIFFIDIAVPRDIDPAVNTLDNIYLYDIDDLKEVVEENRANRRDEADKAHEIVKEEVEDFAHWLEQMKVLPVIRELLQRGENAAEIELAKAFKKLGSITADQREIIEHLAHSIIRKMNHDPVMYLKEMERSGENIVDRMENVRYIFNLDRHNSHSRFNK